MTELEKDIETALHADCDLSPEEYAQKCALMDESTKNNGVEGDAPIDENTRYKRIQSNFYATAMNVLINIYQIIADMSADIEELKNNGRSGKNE
jgi:hypothetical protein